ncbi:MAG TPA: hypothetical protein VMF35_13880 [Acidimicrobiales bacterium]|jgi:hypothetical protein|nr:hypothetical protein [Acidimicrobiales bacterium]
MGCLFGIVAAFSARFALFLLWIFTDRLSIAFRSGWAGVLGFLFLPYTALFYALVYAPGRGVGGFGWVIVALGLVIDFFSHFVESKFPRGRSRRAPAKGA